MILITGAAGHLGKTIIDFLLERNSKSNEIAALVRDPARATEMKAKGIEVRVGDYNNYESLIAAFKGIDKLLLISGTDMQNRSMQHENVVKAAKEAGLKHILYTSFERKREDENSPISFLAKSHLYTERIIKESGMHDTIFRNGLYADVLPMFLGQKVLEKGIYFPAGETNAAFTLRKDIAEAIACVLTTDGHEKREYSLSSNEAVSFPEIAGMLSDIVKSKVTYFDITVEKYLSMAEELGVPGMYAGFLAGFGEAIRQGEFQPATTDLEKFLGRKPTPLKQFLAGVYSNNG